MARSREPPTEQDGAVSAGLGAIAAGASATVTVVVRPASSAAAAGSIGLSARVAGNEADPETVAISSEERSGARLELGGERVQLEMDLGGGRRPDADESRLRREHRPNHTARLLTTTP